ncbi:unnamed protein product [Closterium sp. Naga37s-1]|nr:unnamed protein product [Closterium sp. Naga37s-1]
MANCSDLPFSPPLNIQVNLTGKEDWQVRAGEREVWVGGLTAPIPNGQWRVQGMRHIREGPLFQMDSGGCKSCGIYEKGWIADSPYLLFPLCESNFSTPKGHSPAPGAAGFGELLLADPTGTVEFVLSCPACVRDLEMSTGDVVLRALGSCCWPDPKGTFEFVLSCPACVRDLEMSTGDGELSG